MAIFVESESFDFDSVTDSRKGETRGMDVWIHCHYREFTAKYSTPDSILTVNIKLNIIVGTLFQYVIRIHVAHISISLSAKPRSTFQNIDNVG